MPAAPVVDTPAQQTVATQQAEAAAPVAVPAKKMAPYPWIVNPWFDTLFVFGGALWALFGLHYFIWGWNPVDATAPVMGAAAVTTFLVILGVFGQHMFADTHTVATYMRIYATPESRKTFRLYAYYLPWLSLVLLCLALRFKEAAGIVVYIHMMWVYQHYVGQCFGLGLIYCYKRGYYMTNYERETLRWFMHSLSFVVITRMLTSRNDSPLIYWVVEVPFWGLPAWIFQFGMLVFCTMGLLVLCNIARKWHREKRMIPLPTVCLIGTVGAIGLVVGMAGAMVWIYGPPFFHGSQYMAVSLGYYIKEKGLPEGMIPTHMFREFFTPRALKYWAYVVVGGMFIYIFFPHFMMYWGLSFGLTATVVQACINFHHFVSDAAIWRLRDPRCRDVLIA